MKRRHLILLFALLLGSCTEQPRPAQQQRDTSLAVVVDATNERPTAVVLLELDSTDLPEGVEREGGIIGGARWRDADGEHVLLVTWEVRPAEIVELEGSVTMTEEFERDDLRAYHYRLAGRGSPQLVWKVHDYAENPCDDGRGLVSRIEVLDLDGDGRAENAFVYNVAGPCDVSPVTYKLMLHSGAQKYAVRGTTRVDLGDGEPMGGDKRFDSTFATAPQEFRSFASSLWDRAVGQFHIRLANRE